MLIDFLVTFGPILQVLGFLALWLAGASFVIWVVVGAVLWITRNRAAEAADETDPEWFEALPAAPDAW